MADLDKPYKITERVNGILEKTLNTVEPKFVKQVVEWVSKFQTSSGNITRSKSNKDRIATFKTAIERHLQRAGYYDMISQFLVGFDEMSEAQTEIQQDLNAISLTKSFLNSFKRVAINQVITNMKKQGLLTALINPLRNQLNIAVNQGSSLSDTVASIRGQLETTEKRQGILKKLSLQSTRDALGQYDGVVNEAVRKTYKLDAILYVGSLVKDSRAQCERWTQYMDNGKRGLILFEQLEQEIMWADANGTGMIPNTTPENFCQNRGGFNCRHVAYPVRNPNKITTAGNVSEKVDPEISKKEQELAITNINNNNIKFSEAKNINEVEKRLSELTISGNKINLGDTELNIANLVLKKVEEFNKKNIKIYDVVLSDDSAAFAYSPSENTLSICKQATNKITERALNYQIQQNKWYNAGARLAISNENMTDSFTEYSIEHEFNHVMHYVLINASKGGYGNEYIKETKKWNNDWNNYISKINRKEKEWSPSIYVTRFVYEKDFTKEWLAESYLYYRYNKNIIKDEKIVELLDRFTLLINKITKN
jgi:hypothetical protein